MPPDSTMTEERHSQRPYKLVDSYEGSFVKAEGSEDYSVCSSTEDSTSIPVDQNSKEFSGSSSSESYSSQSDDSHSNSAEDPEIVIYWERSFLSLSATEASEAGSIGANKSKKPLNVRSEEEVSPRKLEIAQNRNSEGTSSSSSGGAQSLSEDEENIQRQLPPQETQTVSIEGRPLVPFDANHRRSTSLVGTQALVPTVDPEEEERRQQEVNHAMEALEHMRRANLVVEFGPNVQFDACVHCLRTSRDRHSEANPLKKVLRPILKRKKLDTCLICHSPICKKHLDVDFVERKIILCQECAPLFDLDVLIDLMQNNSNNNKHEEEHTVRKLLNLYDRALLALRYSSQNFDDTAQKKLLQTYRNKQGLGLGSTVTNIASGVTGLAGTAVILTPLGPSLLLTSLVLGGIATAVGSGSFLVEQLCPQTQQAEQTIALASMVDSLLEAISLLREARLTSTPRLPLLENGSAESEDDSPRLRLLKNGNAESEGATPRLPRLESSNADSEDDNLPVYQADEEERPILFLEQDKEQQILIAALKGELEPHREQQLVIEKVKRRKAREQRARGPFGFLFRNDKEGNKRHQYKRRMDSEAQFDKILEDIEEEERQGRIKKAARKVGASLSKTKHRAVEAASVAKTAATLAAVGMAAGSSAHSGHFHRSCRRSSKDESSEQNKRGPQHGFQLFVDNLFSTSTNRGQMGSGQKKDREDFEAEEPAKGNSVVEQAREFGEGRYANEGFMNILDRVVAMFSERHSSMDDLDARERCLVAKIRLKNTELLLKSSARGMKELTRTGFKLAKQQARNTRSSFVNRRDHELSSSDRLVVKHARFVVKASISVLRETARFTGGAFSAAIVFVETVELKQAMDRIRAGNPCATAEQLQRLRQDVWSNHSAFLDTRAFEQELFFKVPDYTDESSDSADTQPRHSDIRFERHFLESSVVSGRIKYN